MRMASKLNHLKDKQARLISSIEYYKREKKYIQQKIELTKSRHEFLSNCITRLKKDLANITPKPADQQDNHRDAQILNASSSMPHDEVMVKIEKDTESVKIKTESPKPSMFDKSKKKQLMSNIVKSFKNIVGKHIAVKTCRRLNKVNLLIMLNSNLSANNKIILVEDKIHNVKVQVVDSSHKVLPMKKCRRYYLIIYVDTKINEGSVVIENINLEDDNDKTEKDCLPVIILTPTKSENVSDDSKFYISSLGNKIINEYFYLISSNPFEISPINGDVVIDRKSYDSLKPIIIENMINKQPNTIPCIQIVPKNDLNKIKRDIATDIAKKIALDTQATANNEHSCQTENITDSREFIRMIDLTENCSSKALNSEQHRDTKQASNGHTIKNNSERVEGNFVRTSVRNSSILKTLLIREHIKWDPNESRPMVAENPSGSILLDSDDE